MNSKDPNYFHVFAATDFKKLELWLDERKFTHFKAEANLLNRNNKPMVSLRDRSVRDDGRINNLKSGLICFDSHDLRDEALPMIKAKVLAKKYS